MSNIQRRRRGKNWYLYEVTSRRVNGEVKTETKYLGPEAGTCRQTVDEAMMRELSQLLLRPGLDKHTLGRIAKKYDLKMPTEDPKLVVLENDLFKKTLYARIK